MNRYLERRAAKQRIGEGGRDSERALIKKLKGKARPGSGNKTGAKGDMALGEVLIEAKSTSRDSVGIKLAWLLKIGHEATSEGKTPALILTFLDETGAAITGGEWAMVPLRTFREWQDV